MLIQRMFYGMFVKCNIRLIPDLIPYLMPDLTDNVRLSK